VFVRNCKEIPHVTCTIPVELEQRLAAQAAKQQTTVDKLVAEALSSYLSVESQPHIKDADRAIDKSNVVTAEKQLSAFSELQKAVSLTPQAAELWKQQILEARR
jgi:hypothetical protein